MKINLERLVKRWQPRLGLQHWSISICWNDGSEGASLCNADPQYLRAAISISPKEKEIESTVVHEMLHCLTGALRLQAMRGVRVEAECMINHMDDELVTQLERAFMRAYGLPG